MEMEGMAGKNGEGFTGHLDNDDDERGGRRKGEWGWQKRRATPPTIA